MTLTTKLKTKGKKKMCKLFTRSTLWVGFL